MKLTLKTLDGATFRTELEGIDDVAIIKFNERHFVFRGVKRVFDQIDFFGAQFEEARCITLVENEVERA